MKKNIISMNHNSEDSQLNFCMTLLNDERPEDIFKYLDSATLIELDIFLKNFQSELKLSQINKREEIISKMKQKNNEIIDLKQKEIKESKKLKKISKMGWLKSVLGAITGKTKSDVALTSSKIKKHIYEGIESLDQIVQLNLQDTENSQKADVFYYNFVSISILISKELKKEMFLTYRFKKNVCIYFGIVPERVKKSIENLKSLPEK